MDRSRLQQAQPEEWADFAVIGGGPAGTAAALAARRLGLSVVMWERDRFPRDKVCGEFLSWESLPVLKQEVPAELARAAVIRRAEFIPRRGRVYAFPLPGEARGLSRRSLDQALWRAAAASGVDVREGETVRAVRAIRAARSACTGWQVEPADRGASSARDLLLACGRWWALEGFPSPARKGEAAATAGWLGAKAHFSNLAPRDAVEMYFFPGGYCCLAPIEQGLYNACCLVHRSLARDAGGARFADFAAWLNLTARHQALDTRLRGAVQVSKPVATAPVRPACRRGHQQGALLAGDAAGFLDPFTGGGISMALHTGRVAAELVAETRCRNPHTSQASAAAARADAYRHRVGAVRRSFRVATLLRLLLRAPDLIQESAAILLSNFAPQLSAQTRWRECGD
jgi:flavin-dependent dehydrogenase